MSTVDGTSCTHIGRMGLLFCNIVVGLYDTVQCCFDIGELSIHVVNFIVQCHIIITKVSHDRAERVNTS